jgi:hypothetical protein
LFDGIAVLLDALGFLYGWRSVLGLLVGACISAGLFLVRTPTSQNFRALLVIIVVCYFIGLGCDLVAAYSRKGRAK